MRRVFAIAALLLVFAAPVRAGEVIALPAPGKAFLASSDPTLTFLARAERAATGTVIFIPGGDGRFPLRESATELKGSFFNGVFLPLTKSAIHVVIVNSPYAASGRNGNPGADRLDRIESAVRFYKAKLGVPIILFGHSNGGAAVIEFANRSAENRQLISRLVLSGARRDFELAPEVRLPVLILHHKSDGCDLTPYESAVSRLEGLKRRNVAPIDLVTIEGGDDTGPPCSAGYHMYQGAYQAAAQALAKHLSD